MASNSAASFGYVALLWNWFPWKDSFVVVPLTFMVTNIILASLLSLVTTHDLALRERALRMIGLISGASISIVTLTFSLTVLSVQIASQTYTPRLLDDFLKEPVSKMVISVNLGAYTFCYTLLYFIDETDDEAEVPWVAIHGLTAHAAIVLVTFVSFIHVFMNGFRIEIILERCLDSSLLAAERLSSLNTDLERDDPMLEVPNHALKVSADESGYITHFNFRPLVDRAQQLDLCLRYTHQIGEYVNRGTILCYVWDAKTRKEKTKEDLGTRVVKLIDLGPEETEDDKERSWEAKVEKRLGIFANEGVCFAKKRNSDMDVTLGIQQISDIAVRALSPGVNDPHTAIQCMDVLTSLLATLARMPLGLPNARDEDDNLRVCAPRRSYSYLLSMLDSIRRYGGNDLGVCRRGMRLFGDIGVILARVDQLEHLPTVLAQLDQWMLVAEENFASNSQELSSLKDLYSFVQTSIAQSDNIILHDDEGGAKDLQEFETTYNEDEDGENTGSKRDQGVAAEFLNRVNFMK